MGRDGNLTELNPIYLNRPTREELDAAVLREYLQQTMSKWAPGLALDILQGVLDLASFVPLLGNIAAALNGAIAAARGDGLNAALNFLAILPLLGGVKGAAKAAQELEKAILAAGKKGKATEDLLAALRILKDPASLAEKAAKLEQALAQALKSGNVTAAEIEALLVKRGMTKAQAAAKVKELENLAAGKVFKVGKHGEMPSPRNGAESHHGVMSRWMEEHFQGYNPNNAPAILMDLESHNATRGVYNAWRAEMRQRMGGTFDWSKVTREDILALSERMLDAAGVPAAVRAEYYRQFEAYLKSLTAR